MFLNLGTLRTQCNENIACLSASKQAKEYLLGRRIPDDKPVFRWVARRCAPRCPACDSRGTLLFSSMGQRIDSRVRLPRTPPPTLL